jgi:START domain
MKYFIVILLFLSLTVAAQTDCVLKLNKDSIQVYACPTQNSKYKTIKVNFTLKATFKQVEAMLMDIDHLGEWQYLTTSARLVKKINEREIIYHTEVNAPVIDNRDFVIQLKLEEDKTAHELNITATSLPDYLPKVKNVVRIPMSKAVWKIREAEKGKLSVEYIIEIDFGGIIPAWVVNSLSHKAPYETFKSMRELIGKYK